MLKYHIKEKENIILCDDNSCLRTHYSSFDEANNAISTKRKLQNFLFAFNNEESAVKREKLKNKINEFEKKLKSLEIVEEDNERQKEYEKLIIENKYLKMMKPTISSNGGCGSSFSSGGCGNSPVSRGGC